MAENEWLDQGGHAPRWDFQLRALDSTLEAFAARHGVELLRNERESVGRSLRWGANPSGLIQLFLTGMDLDQWKLWLCCFEDRERERFWMQDYLIDGKPLSSFAGSLPQLLDQGFERVDNWMAHPETLKLATNLGPLPRS